MKNRFFVFVILFVAVGPKIGTATELFTQSHLEYDGEIVCSQIEDINHDHRKDILLLLKNDNKEVWFSLFLQNENGFVKNPQQIFPVPQNLILFDIGNVNREPNKELVYFRPDGLYFYVFKDGTFILQPQKLLATNSIFKLANPNSIIKWDFVADLNDDGVDELFVPKVSATSIYFREADSQKWQENRLSLRPESNTLGTQWSRFSLGSQVVSSLFMPYIFREDFNRDSRRDLLAVYKDSLLVFCQKENGTFETTCRQKINLHFGDPWKGAKIHRNRIGTKSLRKYLLKVIDLNDDGRIDLIASRISTEKSFISPENEILIYYGKQDTSNAGKIYFTDDPDQRIRPGGTHLVMDMVDLNKDGKLDLIIPVVKVGVRNIIRMMLTKSVEIQAETYLMRNEGVYPRKPNFKNKIIVKFSYRGGPTSPVYEIDDFNGDGFEDILTSAEQKKLVFFWGNKEKVLDSKVGAEFRISLPQDGELVSAMDLNNDGKCDVIITYPKEMAEYHSKRVLSVLMAN